jgi:nucleotide-binding universal stress UspA family protein
MSDPTERALDAIDAIPGTGVRVLVECRDSPAGRAALRTAAALARERDALVTVVATTPAPGESRKCCGPFGDASWTELMTTEARAELDQAAGELGEDIDVEYALARGRRAKALLCSAELFDADVVIVAGRAPRSLRAHAGCTVLGT